MAGRQRNCGYRLSLPQTTHSYTRERSCGRPYSSPSSGYRTHADRLRETFTFPLACTVPRAAAPHPLAALLRLRCGLRVGEGVSSSLLLLSLKIVLCKPSLLYLRMCIWFVLPGWFHRIIVGGIWLICILCSYVVVNVRHAYSRCHKNGDISIPFRSV